MSINKQNKIRVRFAPSPTGDLHIGGVRTALFNWLFARKVGGTFILRIEDTDEARSTEESVGVIIEAMKWLGLDWDEGPGKENSKYAPYSQMQRKEQGLYKKYIDELIGKGLAYPCYCAAEEVEKMRQTALLHKRPPKYDGTCSRLSAEQRKQKEADGKKAVIRFKMPVEGKVEVDDIVRGHVEFENALLDDFVLMKANGVPTYNFACVIDDHLMDISHVIRGDDHLSNTPRQIHIYKALGWDYPEFAHLAMILGSDGARLSKRHGHTSVLEYRIDGYLPEALLNYLSLLGWSTEDSQQLFEPQELIQKFSLERCGTSPSTFDSQKLLWMNGEYIRKKSPKQLTEIFFQWLKVTNLEEKIKGLDRTLIEKTITLEQEKTKLLSNIPELIDFFFKDAVEYKEEAVSKVFKTETAKTVLEGSIAKLQNITDFKADILEKLARDLAQEKGIKAGQVFHPIRVAISGRTQGPSLFHMMEVMGKETVLKRINFALEKFFK
ncbi:MAG: glutamate--tRNA ligase [Elusimicrobia bacterium]|nr:glutamate--tRNA ligase [Elusimicrobiota bacterium]